MHQERSTASGWTATPSPTPSSPLRRGDRLRHRRRAPAATPRTIPAPSGVAGAGLAGLPAAARTGRPRATGTQWWAYVPGACWRTQGPGQPSTARATPGGPRRLRGRRGLRRVGRARRCRPRPSGSAPRAAGSRARRSPGATSSPRRRSRGQHLAGRVPVAEHCAIDGYEGTSPVGNLPGQRLRPLRHGRQRVGVDRDWFAARRSAAGSPAAATGEAPAAAPLQPIARAEVRPRTGSYDPDQPAIRIPRRVLKGGSTSARPTTACAIGRRRAPRRSSTPG